MQFQKANVVHSEDNLSSDAPSDNVELVKKLRSKNPWSRIYALGKINKSLQTMTKDKSNKMEQRLLKGFYTSNLAVLDPETAKNTRLTILRQNATRTNIDEDSDISHLLSENNAEPIN